jgi:hypothetical protein
MGEIHTFPTFAPARASRIAAALLNKHSVHEISEAIELLIDVLDLIGPPDEDAGDLAAVADGLPGDVADAEPDDDAKGDLPWIEWHTRGRHKDARFGGERLARDRYGNAAHEDDEDDDPAEEGDDEHDTGNAEDEELTGAARRYSPAGPGCPVSDEGGGEHDGRESEQMLHDVPMLKAYTLDHNLFNDQRVPLGITNLSSSFVGKDVRSADTGRVHSRSKDAESPGAPV